MTGSMLYAKRSSLPSMCAYLLPCRGLYDIISTNSYVRIYKPFYAKQSQFKPNSNPIQTQFKANKAKNKPNLPQFKPNQSQLNFCWIPAEQKYTIVNSKSRIKVQSCFFEVSQTMKHIAYLLLPCIIISLTGCESPSTAGKIDDEVYEKNAISNRNKLSTASKRALERNYEQGPEWFCSFRKQDLRGDFKYEEGVIRRDPTAVILVGDTYYVWYTKGEGKAYGFGTGDPSKKVFPWDLTEV